MSRKKEFAVPPTPTQHTTPKWVKYSIGAAVLVLIAVVGLLVAGGHGPWQHQSAPHSQMAH